MNFFCLLGYHGPDIFEHEWEHRAKRTGSLERTCQYCGAIWHGAPIEGAYGQLIVWSRDKTTITKAQS